MKKTVKIISGLLITMVLVCAGAVVAFADTPLSDAGGEVTYDKFLSALQTLEGYADEYKASHKNETMSANRLVMNYLRSGVYYGTTWTVIAGRMNSDFVSYVNSQNECDNVKHLRDQLFITLPDGNKTDLAHMFAAMEAYANGFKNFGGWYGDLAQVMVQVSKISGTKYDIQKAYNEAAKMINKVDTLFNPYDMIADMDAYYLMSFLSLNKSAKISVAIEACIGKSATEKADSIDRYTAFINNCLGLSTNASYKRIASRLALVTVKDAPLVTVLGVMDQPDPVRVSSAVRIGARLAFAKFLYDTVNPSTGDTALDAVACAIENEQEILDEQGTAA